MNAKKLSALIGFTLVLTTIINCNAKSVNQTDFALLPLPRNIEWGETYFEINNVEVNSDCWNEEIHKILTSHGLKQVEKASFRLSTAIDDSFPDSIMNREEAYRLKIDKTGVSITSPSQCGIYWGLMTLKQLFMQKGVPGKTLPECNILDWPAFSVRGFMMDCGRSYISLEELKREIKVMSNFKMNYFHWHLTENQGMRLESKKFPQLNSAESMVRDKGKYYTAEEAKDLVKWAKEHNITVIPEIDMPGHSAYFEPAMGFAMQSEQGVKVMKELIDEACEIFEEVPYFHIGTDEVAFTNPDFVPQMVEQVRKNGKKAISWNPGWKYKEGEIDLMQMWSYRGKTQPGIPAVDSRFHYINHFDTYADIVGLYHSNIYHETKETDNVKGVILALWNDRYIDNESLLITQNNLYPLLLATAERAWDGGGTEYFDNLGTNLGVEGSEDYNNFVDFERRMLAHKSTTLKDLNIPYVKQTNVKWLITDAFPNNGVLNKVFPPETEPFAASYFYEDSVYKTKEAIGGGIYLRHVWGETIPAFYVKPDKNHTAYAYTNVYSPEDQIVGLQVETQNYSRSEPDLAPQQGKWDYRDSKIWLNGVELLPPTWTATHTIKDNETSMGNENMATRQPMLVKLNKGWNKVMLKLPIGEFNSPEVRLVKWMFTFIFTTPDGKDAAPDLIYDPYHIND